MRAPNDQEPTSLEAKLRPGAMSASGFLAPGERLADVLAADRQALADLGVSTTRMADEIEWILGHADRRRTLELMEWFRLPDAPAAGEASVEVEGRFDVQIQRFMGWQECPFQGLSGNESCTARQRWATTDFVIANRATGETLRIAGLAAHLIRAHAFFEGAVPYRIDPLVVARVLELGSRSGGPIRWRNDRCWLAVRKIARVPFFGIGSPARYWDALHFGRGQPPARWTEQREIAPGVELARAEDWGVLVVRKRAPVGARIDGDELLAGRTTRGTFALTRSDFVYLDVSCAMQPR